MSGCPHESALDRCKAQCAKRSAGRAHPGLRVNENVRRVSCDDVAPLIERKRTLHKLLAERGGLCCCRIGFHAGVVAKQAKPTPIELTEPALDRRLPDRVPAKMPAYKPDPNGVIRCGWRSERNGRKPIGHDLADQRAIGLRQVAIVQALIGKEERMSRTDAGCPITIGFAGCDVFGKLRELLPIGFPPLEDFGLACSRGWGAPCRTQRTWLQDIRV